MPSEKEAQEWTIFNLAGATISFFVFTVLAVITFAITLALTSKIALLVRSAPGPETLFLGSALLAAAVTVAAGLSRYRVH